MTELNALDRLRLGDHVCHPFDDDEGRFAATAGYVAAGLRDNHRVTWVTDTLPPQQVLAGLARHGLDAALGDQFTIVRADEAYLVGGAFDPDQMLHCWRHEGRAARLAGYAGLRVVGDMTWVCRGLPGTERLDWYEQQVNRVFADGYAMAVCLYDRRLFGRDALRRVCAAHPATAGPDAGPGWRPLLRVTRTEQPAGVRLDGEVDLSNRYALQAVLGHLLDDTAGSATTEPDGAQPGTATVDLGGLRFADTTAVRLISQAALDAAGRIRITGSSPAVTRMLALHGAVGALDLSGAGGTA